MFRIIEKLYAQLIVNRDEILPLRWLRIDIKEYFELIADAHVKHRNILSETLHDFPPHLGLFRVAPLIEVHGRTVTCAFKRLGGPTGAEPKTKQNKDERSAKATCRAATGLRIIALLPGSAVSPPDTSTRHQLH
jgi:hypothetical protein